MPLIWHLRDGFKHFALCFAPQTAFLSLGWLPSSDSRPGRRVHDSDNSGNESLSLERRYRPPSGRRTATSPRPRPSAGILLARLRLFAVRIRYVGTRRKCLRNSHAAVIALWQGLMTMPPGRP